MAAGRTYPHLFDLQPLLLPKGFPACPRCQVSVTFIKYQIGLLPGVKFFLQGSKLRVLPSDAAEGQGNHVL